MHPALEVVAPFLDDLSDSGVVLGRQVRQHRDMAEQAGQVVVAPPRSDRVDIDQRARPTVHCEDVGLVEVTVGGNDRADRRRAQQPLQFGGQGQDLVSQLRQCGGRTLGMKVDPVAPRFPAGQPNDLGW